MPPKQAIATESARPWASAMPTNPPPLLMGSCVDKIAAMPAKHRKNVPRASTSINRVVLIEVLSDKPGEV
jgi:hypothetical protein